ncbi:hypothetical protein MKZ38_000257 [Zalerion maritima]|uniref:Uncharacterized protein n=1 Tax=Zalerion maritima TaxID=339359 RepID=A0AAD5RZP2_9PEZI|nr:hypothetical protein MKZ38_000257 [Zalerion maritima]
MKTATGNLEAFQGFQLTKAATTGLDAASVLAVDAEAAADANTNIDADIEAGGDTNVEADAAQPPGNEKSNPKGGASKEEGKERKDSKISEDEYDSDDDSWMAAPGPGGSGSWHSRLPSKTIVVLDIYKSFSVVFPVECAGIVHFNEPRAGLVYHRQFITRFLLNHERLCRYNLTWTPSITDAPIFHPKHDRVLHGEAVFAADRKFQNENARLQHTGSLQPNDFDLIEIEKGISYIEPTYLRHEVIAEMCNHMIKQERRRFMVMCPQFKMIENELGDVHYQLQMQFED